MFYQYFQKFFEKLMHKRLVSFLVDKCNVIKTNQYGFRENHFTYIMALLTMLYQISQEIDSKKYSFGLFLDLSQAFDTTDHHILLKRNGNGYPGIPGSKKFLVPGG